MTKEASSPSPQRIATRVLFITRDVSLLKAGSPSLDGMLSLAELFEEVHILVLRQGRAPKDQVERVANNVWIYTAAAPFWWLTPGAARRVIEKQLVFAAGFRVDLIVARDPFESALVAAQIAEQFERPAQLHVLEDYTQPEFPKKESNNFWRRLLAQSTIKEFHSVRAGTSAIKAMLQRQYPIPDLEVLPRFQNYSSLTKAATAFDLKEKYKPMNFFILYSGKLGHESTLYRAIDAVRFALQNERVGMVVLGDGPAKSEFQKRAKIHGIDKHVIFETKPVDTIAYLKGANVVIVTDTDEKADDVVLQAAALGVPVVMSRTEYREDIFEHGVSAYLCEETDIQSFARCINDLLNNVGLRKILTENASAMMDTYFHQDLHDYKETYRASIESARFPKEVVADDGHIPE